MRCLIIPSPDTTSLNIIIRCMSIAAEAIEQGHEVCVLAPPSLVERFSHLNLKVYDYPLPPTIERVNMEAPPIKKYGDYAQLIGLNAPEFIERSLDVELKAIDEFTPDVIYSDLNLTASISARIRRKPLASLCNLAWIPPYLLDDSFKEDEAQVRPFNVVLARHGLEAIRDLSDLIFLYSDVKVVPTCREFEQFPPGIENIEYIGYLYSEKLEQQSPVAVLPDGAVNILVYMGIGDIDLEMMREVLPQAFNGTDYSVTVVAGDFYPELPPPTSNVSYVRFLPLRQALAKTSLALFHGGSGLVMTCLLYGVPGLMFPCGVYEREFHAETMAKVGAGVVLYEKEDFTAQNLRAYAEAIMNGEYRKNAINFGRYLLSLGGSKRTVTLLSDLAACAAHPAQKHAPVARASR
ncbi:MAG TPA: nucleotide disphospho-sugar-binding domain-containing protein [Blastocatellia bacterium]|jgi:UDP:flavonoid glycosyltransferase YjiC (YdhE family)